MATGALEFAEGACDLCIVCCCCCLLLATALCVIVIRLGFFALLCLLLLCTESHPKRKESTPKRISTSGRVLQNPTGALTNHRDFNPRASPSPQ